jgi:hypothetical protein
MEDNDKIIQPKPNRKSTLRLTQEFNEKYFTEFRKRKSLLIGNFSIMKYDITNYRPLSEQQLIQVETLSDTEKIELIKLYNTMFSTLENIVN